MVHQKTRVRINLDGLYDLDNKSEGELQTIFNKIFMLQHSSKLDNGHEKSFEKEFLKHG